MYEKLAVKLIGSGDWFGSDYLVVFERRTSIRPRDSIALASPRSRHLLETWAPSRLGTNRTTAARTIPPATTNQPDNRSSLRPSRATNAGSGVRPAFSQAKHSGGRAIRSKNPKGLPQPGQNDDMPNVKDEPRARAHASLWKGGEGSSAREMYDSLQSKLVGSSVWFGGGFAARIRGRQSG